MNIFLNKSRLSLILFLLSFFALPAHAIVFQPPLTVDDAYIKTNGNVITGNFQGTTTQAAITIKTAAGVTVSHSILKGPGDLIQATSVPATISVINTIGIGTNPNINNMQKGIFLHVNSFNNINMQNNKISHLRLGFYCNGYAGNKSSANTLVIDKNVFLNVDGRPSNGSNSYASSGQYNGQAIHLGNVIGVPGIDIGWNHILNTAGQSSTGALIEINESSGTSASPMQIHDNYISGAFPTVPGKDLYAFGGILVNGQANDTTSNASSFINIANNRVNATANYGIAVLAGHDVTITANRVISSGFLPDGITLYAMSAYGNAAAAVNLNLYNQPASVFFNNSVNNNVLGLIKNNGVNLPQRSDWILTGQGGALANNISFVPDTSLSPAVADEANELADWRQATHVNNIAIGTPDTGYMPDMTPLTPTAPMTKAATVPVILDHVSISNPGGNCIDISGGAPVTITNSVIGPCGGRGIHVAGSINAVIQNNYVHDVTGQGISVETVAEQTVQQNSITNAGFGIYIANNNSVDTSANVDYNELTNITGMTTQNTSVIQFNQITGPNNSISCNVYYQPQPATAAGFAGPCDSFSLFLSSGTAASPIKVEGNRINGGGDFWNCGGVMLSDGDTGPGTTGPGYVYAHDNLLINPGNYGMDVSTGHDITIDDNYVYGDNYNFYSTTNKTFGPGRLGINTFNVYSSNCTNMTVTNNTAYYLSSLTRDGSPVNYGLGAECSPTTQSNNVGYNEGQAFQFPSFYETRPSCTLDA
jgi:parallel beta-helix repeat protein